MSKHKDLITRKVREARSQNLARRVYLMDTINYYSSQMEESPDPLHNTAPICRFMVERAKKDLDSLNESDAEINRLSKRYHELSREEKIANIDMEEPA